MLRSGLSKAKRAKNHVEEGLEKVRAKPWAEPLGKALEVTGKIVEAVDGFVPGANIIGGALALALALALAEKTRRRLHLRETQKSRCFFIVCGAVIIMQHYITLRKITKLR